ncbi:MAG: hypothetical protein R6U96_13965 [Promethearchaeia archaeon]
MGTIKILKNYNQVHRPLETIISGWRTISYCLVCVLRIRKYESYALRREWFN